MGITAIKKKANFEGANQLKALMFKEMDIARFRAAYDIGLALNTKWATDVMDNFVFMVNAERGSLNESRTICVLFTACAKMLIDIINANHCITATAADVIHKACDLARSRIPEYTTEDISRASVALNDVWAKRWNKTSTRNILQVKR